MQTNVQDFQNEFGFNPTEFGFEPSEFEITDGSQPSPKSTAITGQKGKGTNNADVLSGNSLDQKISGKDGDDHILGFGGDDKLFGGNGSDTLNGGDDNDVLMGSGLKNSGVENDILTGGQGADTFVLGKKRGSFYTDNTDLPVFGSHALITDFDASEGDVIQLSGSETYVLGAVTSDGSRNLFRDTGTSETGDLIAVIQGEGLGKLTLDSSSFKVV